MSSNFIGSLLNLLVAPILTRLYSPESFGYLALYLSISTVLGITVTLKWENILFIERNSEDLVLKLTTISIIISIAFFSIILLSLFYLNIFLKSLDWIFYLLLYVGLIGLYYYGRSYHSSLGNYKLLSISYVAKIFVSNLVFLLTAYVWGESYYFLLIGTIIGQFIETALLFYKFNWKNFEPIFNFKSILTLAKKYKKFLFFTLPGELLGSLNAQLPVYILSNSYGAVITGYISLIQRLFGIPLKLFTSSTAEVFRREAALKWQDQKNYRDLALKTSFYLFLVSLVPAIILLLTSHRLIPVLFGTQWSDAVPYLKAMIYLFIFQFTISPISYGLYISEKQEVDFIWQLSLLIVCSLAMLITLGFKNALLTIVAYVVSYSIMYIIYFLLIIKFSKQNA